MMNMGLGRLPLMGKLYHVELLPTSQQLSLETFLLEVGVIHRWAGIVNSLG